VCSGEPRTMRLPEAGAGCAHRHGAMEGRWRSWLQCGGRARLRKARAPGGQISRTAGSSLNPQHERTPRQKGKPCAHRQVAGNPSLRRCDQARQRPNGVPERERCTPMPIGARTLTSSVSRPIVSPWFLKPVGKAIVLFADLPGSLPPASLALVRQCAWIGRMLVEET